MALCLRYHIKDIGGIKFVDLIYSANTHDYYKPPNFKYERKNLEAAISILKVIPVNERMFDRDTNIWMISEHHWKIYSATMQNMKLIVDYNQEEIPAFYDSMLDFVNGIRNDKHGPQKPRQKSADEFFYQKTMAASQKPLRTLPELIKVIAAIAQCSVEEFEKSPKKYYRLGALLTHPDRNLGDRSNWDTLEEAWKEYTKLANLISPAARM